MGLGGGLRLLLFNVFTTLEWAMTEKMLLTIEAALHRVLHEALRKADAMYPRRTETSKEGNNECVLYLQCVNGVLAWFEAQIGALRKIRLARRMSRRPGARRLEEEDLSDDWDILLSFFAGSPGTLWMMSVGLSALPQDIRLMLGQMTYVLELAIAGEMQRCLDNLKDLADSFAAESGGREMFRREELKPPPPQPTSREEIAKIDTQALANRVNKMLQPKPSKPSHLKRSTRP